MTKTMHPIGPTALLLGLLLLLGGCQEPAKLAIGQPAPALSAMDSRDQRVSLDAYRGKLLYLNFWSGSCAPCLVELPKLATLASDFAAELVILNINVDTTPDSDTLQALTQRYRQSMAMLRDPLGITQERYEIIGYPSGALIGPDGMLLARYQGLQEADDLRRDVEEAL